MCSGYRIRCSNCQKLFTLCSSCFHGHRYCGLVCRGQGKANIQKNASSAYAKSFKGKRNSAARSKRYRSKKCKIEKIVTHPSSTATAENVKPKTRFNSYRQKPSLESLKFSIGRCFRCGVEVSYFRQDWNKFHKHWSADDD